MEFDFDTADAEDIIDYAHWAHEEIERLKAIIARARPLVALVTVGMVINSDDNTIQASGLNPWCLNEGTAQREDKLSTWWME